MEGAGNQLAANSLVVMYDVEQPCVRETTRKTPIGTATCQVCRGRGVVAVHRADLNQWVEILCSHCDGGAGREDPIPNTGAVVIKAEPNGRSIAEAQLMDAEAGDLNIRLEKTVSELKDTKDALQGTKAALDETAAEIRCMKADMERMKSELGFAQQAIQLLARAQAAPPQQQRRLMPALELSTQWVLLEK